MAQPFIHEKSYTHTVLSELSELYIAHPHPTHSHPTHPPLPSPYPTQVNVRDALLRTISFTAANGKQYRLKPANELATLLVRCAGGGVEGPSGSTSQTCKPVLRSCLSVQTQA
jgi:hypothetical protein